MGSQKALKTLDDFVVDCYLDYSANNILEDPSYEWHISHHPLPSCLGGTKVVPLLKKHHAIHGVLQSEAFQHPCIWGWEADYLEGELYDLCKKWQGVKGIKSLELINAEKNEEGKSVNGVGRAKKLHFEKNEEGKSVFALEHNKKLHAELTQDGKSVQSLKMNKSLHLEKGDDGKSVHAVRIGQKAHLEEDELGRSVHALSNFRQHHEKSKKRIRITNRATGETIEFNSARECCRKMGFNQGAICSVARGQKSHYKGYTATYI